MFVYFIVIIGLMADVALESPTYIVGLAFAIGYILACKEQASHVDSGGLTSHRPISRVQADQEANA